MPQPVTDPLGRGGEALRGEKPQRVAEPASAMSRRVRIVGRVRHLVMDSVMGRPPQRSTLACGASEHGHRQRHRARGAERAVREVAMVEGGDEEHAREVQGGADPQRHRRDPDHCDERARGVQGDERSGAQGVDPPTVRMDRGVERARVVEEPARPMPQCSDHVLPGTHVGPSRVQVFHGGTIVGLARSSARHRDVKIVSSRRRPCARIPALVPGSASEPEMRRNAATRRHLAPGVMPGVSSSAATDPPARVRDRIRHARSGGSGPARECRFPAHSRCSPTSRTGRTAVSRWTDRPRARAGWRCRHERTARTPHRAACAEFRLRCRRC